MEKLYELGLNESEINRLKSIDKFIMNTDFFVNLLIKAHNHGFKKGFNETVKEVENEIKRSKNSIFGLSDSLKIISDFEKRWCK